MRRSLYLSGDRSPSIVPQISSTYIFLLSVLTTLHMNHIPGCCFVLRFEPHRAVFLLRASYSIAWFERLQNLQAPVSLSLSLPDVSLSLSLSNKNTRNHTPTCNFALHFEC